MLKLEETMGYFFKDKQTLTTALTHSSYANEIHINKLLSNERLEFLGDAVLELIISELLFHFKSNVSEGELTKLRASIVCEQSLAYCAKELDIGSFLFLGRGEEATGGRYRDSILSNALEAIIGAIYLDGGFTNAKEFVQKKVYENSEKNRLFFDSKTILQELIQSKHKGEIKYEIISEQGPDHSKVFVVVVNVNNKELGRGEGKTKKRAEQEAAYKAIMKLKNSN